MKQDYYKHKGAQYGMSHTRRDRILSLVPNGELRILDIACASGRLGSMLRNRGHWVAGIDVSEDAIAQAKQVLDRAIQADIEGAWPAEVGDGYDVVILSEILEHVFDPVAVLKQAHRVLKEDGQVIITTPNFMTWTNRLKFLFGYFKYEEQGMFDFGHIRWFTYAYLKDILAEVGFSIEVERHIIFPGKLSRVLRFWPSLFAWQFIVKAEKTPNF